MNYPITPGPVDWHSPDFGGHVHEASYVDAEAGEPA
jgi:acyl-CoA thioesterase FadM